MSKRNCILSSKYQGHQAPVLALDFSQQHHLLLSGSEDHTARLWDVRDSKHRACLCIPTQGEVLSVVFSPDLPNTNTTSSSVNAPRNPFSRDHTIFLSTNNLVLEYDLRMAEGPIVSTPTRDLSPILQNQDEVNQIALLPYIQSPSTTMSSSTSNSKRKNASKKRSSKKHSTNNNNNNNVTTKDKEEGTSHNNSALSSVDLYIAAADDAGKVRYMKNSHLSSSSSSSTQSTFISTTTNQSSAPQSHILHHDPNGVAMVPTIAFRPLPPTMNTNTNTNSNNAGKRNNTTLEMASGGTDCKIHLWDLFKPMRPISSFTIQQPQQDTTDSGNSAKPQVCNPPMVHTLAWSPSGKLLAAGLGDGSIPIFSIGNQKSLVQTGILSEYGHDSSVASVLFPCFYSAVDMDVDGDMQDAITSRSNNDRLLMTGGSDGAIFCWDIGPTMMESGGGGGKTKKANPRSGTPATTTTTMRDPKDLFAKGFLSTSTLDSNKMATTATTTTTTKQDMDNVSKELDDWSFLESPKILFGIPHGRKINWMTAQHATGTIFVSDTTNDITAYDIPLR